MLQILISNTLQPTITLENGRKLMLHWKTREEMGEGYQYNQDEHDENQYNSLVVIDEHETNTMRTKYLIRDLWDINKLLDLKNHLDDIILERKQ
jgi:hypothetical protein